VVLLLGGAAAAVYVALLNPRSCDFLIETDGELRKVVWPETTPVFSPRAEAWGATFVVIITVAVFGAFIWVVDTVLGWILQQGLFPLLFGTGG
jgi:preprotein translocase subunit SecE